MQIFRELVAQNNALRFLFDTMEINSSMGREHLLNSNFETCQVQLEEEFCRIESVISRLQVKETDSLFSKIKHELYLLHNIKTTIERIRQGSVLDDIELFEVKKTAMSMQQIVQNLVALQLPLFSFADLSPVVSILDPDATGLPHFVIYPSYDDRLPRLRAALAAAKCEDERLQIQLEATKVEDEVRIRLSEQLSPYADALQQNLSYAAHVDLLIAKAELALRWHCCRPIFSRDELIYEGLENPLVKNRLVNTGRNFQALDIVLHQQPVLITGSNMSGKTIFLKSIELAQLMCQFGFFVPAKSATISLVDEVITSIGDHQSELSGLSSYCVEILAVNHIIKEAKAGKKLLLLVDELARTTNPAEGKALVAAFVKLLTQYDVFTLITTHYDIHEVDCRRLRVKGLDVSRVREKLTPYNINLYMDYALVETEEVNVPTEALNIAKIFKVDEEFLQVASSFYKETSDSVS